MQVDGEKTIKSNKWLHQAASQGGHFDWQIFLAGGW